MATFVGGMEFERIQIEVRGKRPSGTDISINKNRVNIPSELVKKLGWKEGDRVDLLQSGSIFAFEKNSSGCFTLRKNNANSDSLRIASLNLCRHIRTVTKRDCTLKSKVDGGRVIFTEME